MEQSGTNQKLVARPPPGPPFSRPHQSTDFLFEAEAQPSAQEPRIADVRTTKDRLKIVKE